jgi:hypothetical protein
MLSVVCAVEQKIRRAGAGVQYVLTPSLGAYAAEARQRYPALDLTRARISVYDPLGARARQSGSGPTLAKPDGLGTCEVIASGSGSVFINVLLSTSEAHAWLSDLDACLLDPALIVRLTVAGTCLAGDAKEVEGWLHGTRASAEATWDRAPDYAVMRTRS